VDLFEGAAGNNRATALTRSGHITRMRGYSPGWCLSSNAVGAPVIKSRAVLIDEGPFI
jgi:hypothetical protein